MHIPDAYLSPETQLATGGVMAAMLAVAVRKTRQALTSKQVPLVSIGAAFCFAIQMFNIPALGGTSAHALGTVLLAILLGPWTAMLTLTISLAVQAILFGDGGVLSLGANAFDMALIPAFAGHWIYRGILQRTEAGSTVSLVAAGVAAYLGTALASLSAGLMLGLQPLIAHDASGRPLYFPFGLTVSVPAMVDIHLLVAAPAEAIVTTFALAYLWRNFPEFALARTPVRAGSRLRLAAALILVLILTPIGLLAGAGAWGEWDVTSLGKMIGYVPAGIASSKPLIGPVLPGYGLQGAHGSVWAIGGYVLSAAIGAVLVILATRGLVSPRVVPELVVEDRRPPSPSLPDWMLTANPVAPGLPSGPRQAPSSWLESILLRMRAAIEDTVATERVARADGFVQRMHPTSKTILALCGFIAIALVGRPAYLAVTLAAILTAAAMSRVPLGAFASRVGIGVAFFGLIVTIPAALVAPVGGLELAARILLRLACGLSLALLWAQTTRWHELVASLRRLGLPEVVATAISLAYRYVFVVVRTLEEMVSARRSRQVGAIAKSQARSYSGAGAAILFAKSYAFTDEVHMAMRSRSYDRPARPSQTTLSATEAASVAAGIVAVIFVVWLRTRHAL